MYTAKIINKEIRRELNQYTLTVDFTDGTNRFNRNFQFVADIPVETVKRTIRDFAVSLEKTETNLNQIEISDIDFSTIPDLTPSKGDTEKTTWFRDFARLEKALKLESVVTLSTSHKSKIDELKAKVGANFKGAYLNDM